MFLARQQRGVKWARSNREARKSCERSAPAARSNLLACHDRRIGASADLNIVIVAENAAAVQPPAGGVARDADSAGLAVVDADVSIHDGEGGKEEAMCVRWGIPPQLRAYLPMKVDKVARLSLSDMRDWPRPR